MERRLPFPVLVRCWDESPEHDRSFFCFDDESLPLRPAHAAQIGLIKGADAERLSAWAFSSIPPGWPDRTDGRFAHQEQLSVQDCWEDPVRQREVRTWLFERRVPFRRIVYLIYDRNIVVETNWKMVVRYWNAFAWSVGYAMFAVDHTLNWACCFHHEDLFVFGSSSKRTA